MGLGLTGTNANYITFKPSNGSWQVKDGEMNLQHFLIDLDSVKTGWGLVQAGVAPSWQWDKNVGREDKSPSIAHKRGFSVKLYVKGKDGVGTAYEWSSTGFGPKKGMDALYDLVAKLGTRTADQVAQVTYVGSTQIKVGANTTRVPDFKVVRLIARPADFEATSSNPWSDDDAVAESDGSKPIDPETGEEFADPFAE